MYINNNKYIYIYIVYCVYKIDKVTKGKLYGSRDSDHVIVHLGLNVSSFAHIIVGAWSMAVTLWQQFEYYYYSSTL